MVIARTKHLESQYEDIRIIDIGEWLEKEWRKDLSDDQPYIGRVGKRQNSKTSIIKQAIIDTKYIDNCISRLNKRQ